MITKKSVVIEHPDMFTLCSLCASINYKENQACRICGCEELYPNIQGVQELARAEEEEILYL